MGSALSLRERGLLGGLRTRRNREREGLFLAEGPRVVEELLASSLEIRLSAASSTFVDTERGASLARALAERAPLRVVDERAMAELAPTRAPQGVLVAASIPDTSLVALPAGERALFLALDGVQDPGNVGTLVRTACALGCAGAVSLPGTADAWGPKVVRAAAGALFRLPLVRSDVARCVAWARTRGVEVLAADASGEPLGAAATARMGTALLVLGNEGAGVGADMDAAAERRVAVPQRPGAESLNVAAAGAILMWELLGRGEA